MSPVSIAVLCREAEPGRREQELATFADLPLLAAGQEAGTVEYGLRYEPDGLTLHAMPPRGAGVRVDFLQKELHQRARDSFLRQNLARAIGLKRGRRPSVLDATAGLGRDAFLLAQAGCELTLLEKNPIVYRLLADGIERGRAISGIVASAAARMELRYGDLTDRAESLPRCDVIYLDPMFPPGGSSARSRKAMYYLQQLLPAATGDEALLDVALQEARYRVVVKRAKRAPPCGDREPSLSYRGSSSRFDVYLIPPG